MILFITNDNGKDISEELRKEEEIYLLCGKFDLKQLLLHDFSSKEHISNIVICLDSIQNEKNELAKIIRAYKHLKNDTSFIIIAPSEPKNADWINQMTNAGEYNIIIDDKKSKITDNIFLAMKGEYNLFKKNTEFLSGETSFYKASRAVGTTTLAIDYMLYLCELNPDIYSFNSVDINFHLIIKELEEFLDEKTFKVFDKKDGIMINDECGEGKKILVSGNKYHEMMGIIPKIKKEKFDAFLFKSCDDSKKERIVSFMEKCEIKKEKILFFNDQPEYGKYQQNLQTLKKLYTVLEGEK